MIVLDVKMCKLDGLEALRKIKADPRLKRIPVVMFSSSELEADIMKVTGRVRART